MDAPENQPQDRLEHAWLRLAEKIRQREVELELLKKEFSILDKARALILDREQGRTTSASLEVRSSKVGLRGEVLTAVKYAEFGLSFSALVACIREKIDTSNYASDRSLNAAIQTTVRRLVTGGELALSSRNGKIIYIQGPKSSDTGNFDHTPDTREHP